MFKLNAQSVTLWAAILAAISGIAIAYISATAGRRPGQADPLEPAGREAETASFVKNQHSGDGGIIHSGKGNIIVSPVVQDSQEQKAKRESLRKAELAREYHNKLATLRNHRWTTEVRKAFEDGVVLKSGRVELVPGMAFSIRSGIARLGTGNGDFGFVSVHDESPSRRLLSEATTSSQGFGPTEKSKPDATGLMHLFLDPNRGGWAVFKHGGLDYRVTVEKGFTETRVLDNPKPRSGRFYTKLTEFPEFRVIGEKFPSSPPEDWQPIDSVEVLHTRFTLSELEAKLRL